MGNARIGLIGDYIEALGTVIAALGTTPSVIYEEFHATEDTYPEHIEKLTDYLKVQYGFWGNVLQAIGNEIGALTSEPGSLSKLAGEVGASGNITVIASLKEELSFEEEQALFILGNALQAVGSLIEASLEFEETGELSFLQGVSLVLEAIGNALQILGALLFFDEDIKGGRILIYYGSWIQAIGASFEALFASKALKQDEAKALAMRQKKELIKAG